MTRPGIEPQSLGQLANTLPTRPIGLLFTREIYQDFIIYK